MASSDANASMASSDADASMASSEGERPDDLLFPPEPDPQRAATDDGLQPHPGDWTSYSDDQKLAAPRGAVFETRLAASAALRELGNERYRGDDFDGARVAYERSLWQAHFDEAWVKLELTDDHRGQLFDVTVPANLNCARCLLKTANTSAAKGHVDAALAAEPYARGEGAAGYQRGSQARDEGRATRQTSNPEAHEQGRKSRI